MKEAKSWIKKLTLTLIVFVCLLLASGCLKSTPSLETKPPIEIDFGKQETQPETVWQDYDWVILSRAHYQDTCK